MRLALAAASLRRHPSRTALACLGVAVAGAMLLDMVMLSTGMRESFGALLGVQGFHLRLAPRGTLPFDTEATIGGASELLATLEGHPEVERASPVLGGTVHALTAESGQVVSAFALGIDPRVQGDYRLIRGSDVVSADAVVANADFLRAVGARLGDTLELATGYDPQLRVFSGRRPLVVAGEARFIYLAREQPAVAMPIETLRSMRGAQLRDRVSLVMVRVKESSRVENLASWLEQTVLRVDAISTAEALVRVDERLRYFRQLAFILGAVSMVVGFLLVTTLVTVSVNERIGEIAVLRAIGVSRWHVVVQILAEGTAITLVGAGLGLALGLVTARLLNGILSAFPGLPAAIDFFLFQPRAAWTALGLLVGAGILAGAFPAWRAASLPIARTLREEAVG